MSDQFLAKSQISFEDCLEIGGAPALDRYPALQAILTAHLGPEGASLFAEPLISRGNDKAAPTVSWYTEAEGDGVPATRLDDAAQAALAATLSRRLVEIRALIDDPDDGPLVSAALHVLGPGDIWSVGGKPVILNWGMLPPGLARDRKTRTAHYERTLGRYLPLEAAPPLTDAERQARAERRQAAPRTAAARPAGPAGGVAGSVAAGLAGGMAAPPPPPPAPAVASPAAAREPRRLPLIAWLPLAVLLVLAGGTLAWLLIPGNRLFPEAPPRAAILDAAALELAEEVNRALEERLAGLREALDGAQCRIDGTLLMPDGRTIEGLAPPDPSAPDGVPGAVTRADATPVLPPDPARVVLRQPDGAAQGASPQSLLALLEAQTALVFANGPDGSSTGTGFFVGPDMLVTNHHVIAAAEAGGIFVTNKGLGKAWPAEVVKTSGPMETTGSDFALLRVPGIDQPAFAIWGGAESLKLTSVIAAGYPGDLLQGDAQFQALVAGDAQATPELIVTDGIVNAERQVSAKTSVLVHSAPISTGNSGGPLVDMCGQIVGVNTFVMTGPLRNLSFALSARDLLDFLEGTRAVSMAVSQPCQPEIRRPKAPPPAVASAGAESGAAPGEGSVTLPPLTAPAP